MTTATHRQAGMTLIEMMIALVLGLVVVGAASAVFLSNKQAYTTNSALSEIQSNARIAYELLARDLRQAGLAGCGDANRVANVLTNGPNASATPAWWADFAQNAIRGYDGSQTDPAVTTGGASGQRVTGTSSIELIGADEPTVATGAPNATNTSYTVDASAAGQFAEGNIAIICNPDHATIAQVTGTSATTIDFTHAGNNCSDGLGFPTDCTDPTPCSTSGAASIGASCYQFPSNSQISLLSANTWYIGNNAQGGTSLYRQTLTTSTNAPALATQEMVRDVTNMQLRYLVGTDTDYSTAADVTTGNNWARVSAVRIDLTMRSGAERAGSEQQPLSRTLSSIIALRNPA
ncbi:MAG TPA: PilW family protein [Nevskiaceae bacterium]